MACEQVFVERPPPALRAAVVCAVRRLLEPSPEPVPGVVQANPYACLNWLAQGEVWCGAPLPRRFVTGPLSAPLRTRAQGPLASLSVVLQPWCLPSLLALQPASMVDRLQDLAALPAPAGRWFEGGEAAALTGDLGAFWAALAPALPPEAPGLAQDVLQQHGLAAAAAHLAITPRHYRRLFAAAMGLAPKAWLRARRFEQALAAMADPGAPLGEAAAAAGYADQAHMTREFALIAQDAPGRLRTGLAQQRAGLWALRPAGVRFVQDAKDGGA